MISAASVPKLAKKARLRFDRHQGQHMLLYPERGLLLSASAAAIAERCDGTRTVAEIARQLAAMSEGASAERIEHDVVEFLEDLAGRGLLDLPEQP
ncbi:pyrroloquinoline quinone biosynthesis peptide chaperone PqqD [Pendulispora brunnea]|uniref:Pyrroloquinoline quinone biosynthesis peptide chaperone PqqD n=1 Tax=Pendulispora brunnea TaxID=2905690 RepID=A0ABZ2KC88_9BACT